MSDPTRALGQYLHSLRRAGVTHVPRELVAARFAMACSSGAGVTLQEPAVTVEDVSTSDIKQAATDAGNDSPQVAGGSAATPAAKTPAHTTPAAPATIAETARDATTDATTDDRSLIREKGTAWPVLTPSEKSDTLAILQNEVAACVRCEELAENRTQTVFGVGNPNARLVFLGEAPGADEDRQGEPFVGLAGQKLNEIIEKGMRLSRDDVYIMNVLRCRPPGNRNPTEDEARNCRGFLDRQLAAINPEFICCLGGVAATRLLDSRLTIGRMRGKFYEYMGAKVMATYHPAYLLRNPSARTSVWDDIKMLMSEMGMKIPGE